MGEYLVFGILGLGGGAVTAAIGIGLVMTYKGAGVINFAHAATAIWGALAYAQLRTTGDLILPVRVVPYTVPLGDPMSAVPAILIALALSAVMGILVQLLVFRPLRHSPLIAKIVGSLGVLTLLQTLIVQNFGRAPISSPPLFPSDPVEVGELSFPQDRLWVAAMVLVLAGTVALVYRRTLVGVATRAALEDEVALTLSRWSPTVLAVANVALGVVLTTAVMIGASYASPPNPTTVALLIVPGLTAMLVARLVGVVPAAFAGLALGVIQGELSVITTKTWWPTWLSSGGVTDAVPLVVIILVLVVLGRNLPTRASLVLERLPRVPKPMGVVPILLLGVVVGVAATVLGPEQRLGLNTTLGFAVLALSLVVLVGLIGQISLGQFAIAGIAGYGVAGLFDSWPFPLGLILAGMGAAVVAVLLGLPALRVRGAQLTIVTLAVAVAVQSVVFNNLDSGTNGTGLLVDPPKLGPLDLSVQKGADTGRLAFTIAVLVVFVVVAIATSKLIAGVLGRRFLAVRGNEQASASVGINVARMKVVAFAISGLFAGIGGGLLVYNAQVASAASFDAFLGVTLLVYVYLAGITGIGGGFLAGLIAPGGLVFVFLSQRFDLGWEYGVIAAILLILTVIFNPDGAIEPNRAVVAKLRSRFLPEKRRASPLDTEPAPDTRARPEARLVAEHITVAYGGVVAVDDASLTVDPGEIVGLIGPNGAGKTSLLDALTGFTKARGAATLGDLDVLSRKAHTRYQAGLGRTWQAGQLFEDLTVYDNVRVSVSATGSRLRGLLTGGGSSDDDAIRAMHHVGIAELGGRRPNEISGGQRKLVGIARALAGRPSVLLADEPAAGLDSYESRELGGTLREVAAAGVGILLIEHDLELVLDICDRVYVLEQGRVIACGTPAEIRTDPNVIRAYIGESQPEQAQEPAVTA